jgi:putative glycosyltransferase (TIGR04348 family)
MVIISPTLADANTGNWQTARRWAAFLAHAWQVEIRRDWQPLDDFRGVHGARPDAMIALHARRSAGALERFADSGGPVALVLTGTDLYRDIRGDPSAQRSLMRADRLVCLQEQGLQELPAAVRQRAEVIYQSARTLSTAEPRSRTFDLLMVGHLRPEKDPLTALRALALLPDPSLRLIHVGAVHDPSLQAPVDEAAATDSRIRLRGPLPHARTRQLIRRGRLLLLPSQMEGGANVLIEAVTCGVPVLGSRIPGSIGMLGEDYPGWFAPGNAAELAALIDRCRQSHEFMALLQRHCAARSHLFAPELERAAVRRLAHNLLIDKRRHPS